MTAMSDAFPPYTEFDPAAPVWCITPNEGGCIHRFFDTSPISPSGRYAALTRLPSEDHPPAPGDTAQVVLVDLQTGEERVAAETSGWDTQLGAQAQWAADDSQLCFNDMDTSTWRPFGVVMDPLTGERRELRGTHYMVSPDGTKTASPCLLRTALTQEGYGVVAPDEAVPRNSGAADDDGVYVTDMATGECRLLVSFKQIVDELSPALTDDYAHGDFYGFHVKWNAQGDRIMLVLRWLPHGEGGARSNVITFAAAGSDFHIAIPWSEWSKGGHHPDWCPDGERVMMNLAIHGDGRENLFLVHARYDGTGYGTMTEAVPGSGHPSLHPNGRHVVTDEYAYRAPFGDGTTPIRLIDLAAGTETQVCRINTTSAIRGEKNELRVDPHPAWDPAFTRITFNAFAGGTRRVFIADLTELL
jgi:hypothetical protein